MNFKLHIVYYLLEIKLNKWLYKHGYAVSRKIMLARFFKNCLQSKFYAPFVAKHKHVSNFPLANKILLMSNFNEINTVNIKLDEAMRLAIQSEISRNFSPMIDGITIGLSSGTSGNKGLFLASSNERAYWVALILDRVIGFSFQKKSVAFFLRANSNIYDSVKSKLVAFNFFDLLKPLTEHIDKLNNLQPTILVAQPSMLMELARAIQVGRLFIAPQKIISVAEVLTTEDNLFLTKVFNQTIHQVYQCTEGFLASSCINGTLHFNEDFLLIEKKFIDKEQTRFHPVITDLKRKSQLIIRYELNDIIIEKKHCGCGSNFLAIEAIEGRSDDILVFSDSNNHEIKIFPDFFRRAIILSDSNITDYALIQTQAHRLSLFIKSIYPNSYNLALIAINELLKQYDIHNIIIEQAIDNKTVLGNKLRRIRNDVRKAN